MLLFCQTPIEKLQNHQEALKEEVMTVKAKLKAVLDHTTQLEAMMKALMKHHAISVEEEEEGEDDDQNVPQWLLSQQLAKYKLCYSSK